MRHLKSSLFLALALFLCEEIRRANGQASAPPNLETLSQELDRINKQIEILEAQSGHSITIPDSTVAQSNPTPPVPPPAEDVLASLIKKLDEEKKEELPKKEEPKKWYDKFSLRGYSQFRFNETTYHEPGTAPPTHAGDRSVGDDQSLSIRRARLTFSSNVSDHLFVYLQPEFAATVPGNNESEHFVQLRDLYGDVYLDVEQVNRFRIGLSKVPYGWENLQSSSIRAPLDRNDGLNSAVRNERDLGVFYYWTPEYAQDIFKFVMDENLKGSGNYGVFGFGVYNGQGGSLQEQNDDVHFVSRLTLPYQFENGQLIEASIQGYTGQYVVWGAPIRPLGVGGADITPTGTLQDGDHDGHLDQRIAWSFIKYPQPLGFQAEWNIGRGPALNEEQTAVERRSLYGGYAMAIYKLSDCYGTWFPYARWSYYKGGYKWARNAPYSLINETEMGIEWQIRPEIELTLAYTFTDRTNLDAISSSAVTSEESYEQFVGQLLRCQCQINY